MDEQVEVEVVEERVEVDVVADVAKASDEALEEEMEVAVVEEEVEVALSKEHAEEAAAIEAPSAMAEMKEYQMEPVLTELVKAKIEPLEASQMQLKIAEAVTDRLVRHWAMEVDQYQVLRARVIHQTMTLVVFQFQVAQVVHRTNILEVLHLLHLLVAQAAQLAETFEALQIHLVQTGVFHDFLPKEPPVEVVANSLFSGKSTHLLALMQKFLRIMYSPV